ncbi:MAG: type I restriction enzyme HsdR N-terminal domain-containing protein [Planctomycetes bacterium]|nr:type I restriction enzyme HsdR N-terminal domain-containing protein [Planctomycetota bacterium]
MPNLVETLAEVRRRIQRNGSRSINEENTKATLIEPVLRALGWDVEDVDEVQREFKTQPRHKPVDYGLLVVRTPRLLIEAKAFGENLADHRWINQIMGYATVAGVEWVVLTNGDEYRIYNTHAPVVVDEKLFRSVRVSDEDAGVAQTLELLAKNRLEENRIEVLWRAHFVDRQVRAAVEDLFSRDQNDMLLVNYVAGVTKNLTAEEIRGSLARCRASFDFPLDAETLGVRKRRARTSERTRAARVQAAGGLAELIAAGRLRPPIHLMRTYKGMELAATILATGKVRVGKQEFDSPSTAGVAAIKQASGADRSVNGWDFWQVPTADGKRVPLASFRDPGSKGGRATGT